VSRWQVAALVLGLAAIAAGLVRAVVDLTKGDGLLALVFLLGLAAVLCLWRDALADAHREERDR
jgi:uncharacterized membrane protein